MPEPAEAGKEPDDGWTRDKEDPFSTGEGHAKPLDKIIFVFKFAFCELILARCLFVFFIGWAYETFKYHPHSVGYYFGLGGPIAGITVYNTVRGLKCFGWMPRCFPYRSIIQQGFWMMGFMGLWVSRHSWAHYQSNYQNGDMPTKQNDETQARYFGVFFIYGGWVYQEANNYQDWSAYGIYCCARMVKGRFMRTSGLMLWTIYVDFFVDRIFLAGSFVPNPMVSDVAIPVLIFCKKRYLYAMEISVLLHDSPMKGHGLIMSSIFCLLTYNNSLAMACIGVPEFSGAISYIVVDWFIYALRMIIVARTLMKSMPKLQIYLITKQLENMPAPLPVQAAAQGQKTAMRCTQAFFALAEGETLTVMYFNYLVMFIILWYGLKDTLVLQIVPLRNVIIIFIFSVLDLIQDLLADKVSKKFSDFSYLYMKGGWFATKNLMFCFLFGFALQGDMILKPRAKGAESLHVNPVEASQMAEWCLERQALIHI